MSLRFACTACGRCCHDLRLPLSLDEALNWTRRGGDVEILADAAPMIVDETSDAAAVYRRERALPGTSGTLAITINVTLAATFSGPCPHLLPNMLCGAYEERPNTCRIYPAELLPGRIVDPKAKACPPEAWSVSAEPLLDQAGCLADPDVTRAIRLARSSRLADVAGKMELVRLLGIETAALENEGLVIHRRSEAELLAALEAARSVCGEPADRGAWRFVSSSEPTRQLIAEAGAIAVAPSDDRSASYLSFGPGARQSGPADADTSLPGIGRTSTGSSKSKPYHRAPARSAQGRSDHARSQ